MISKELFIKVIKTLQEQEKIDNEISNAFTKVCSEPVSYNINNKVHSVLYEILETIFKDINGDIFEYVDTYNTSIVKIGKKKVKINTPEKLYDFLVENLETEV